MDTFTLILVHSIYILFGYNIHDIWKDCYFYIDKSDPLMAHLLGIAAECDMNLYSWLRWKWMHWKCPLGTQSYPKEIGRVVRYYELLFIQWENSSPRARVIIVRRAPRFRPLIFIEALDRCLISQTGPEIFRNNVRGPWANYEHDGYTIYHSKSSLPGQMRYFEFPAAFSRFIN